jgi:tape measure domain-containing protein
MATYNLDLIFKGHDQVSGVMGGILGAFSRIGQIATGIIVSRVLWGIADGITSIGTAAIESTALVQRMQITLESLLTREVISKQFEDGTIAAGAYQAALQSVQVPADVLMEKLAKLAILSPFTYEGVTQTFRQAMAFGFASDEAELFTKATLNMAAGIGADNDMLNRMAYNLAQIRLQGKVTALDIRQLALAGFDLRSVLKYVGQQMGVTVENQKDFNEAIANGSITWQDFARLYAQYAETYFEGASERLARTLSGLKSTFQDVFTLTMPKILGPAADVVTVFLNRILDDFMKLRDSGLLEEWGERIRASTERAIKKLDEIYANITELFALMKTGDTIGEAFAKAFDLDPMVGVVIDNIAKGIETASIIIHENMGIIQAAFAAIVASAVISLFASALMGIVSVLGLLLNPLTLLIIAVGLLYLAWTNNWGGIRDIVASVWAVIEPYLTQASIIIGMHIPAAMQQLRGIFEDVMPVVLALWESLQPAIDSFVDTIKGSWPTIMENLNLMGDFFVFILPVIEAVIVILISLVAGIIGGFIQMAAMMIAIQAQITNALIKFAAGIGLVLGGLWNIIIGIFTGNGEKLKKGMNDLWEGIKMVFSNGLRAIVLMIAQPFAAIAGFVSGFVTTIIGFFQNLSDRLVGHSIVTDMVNRLIAAFQRVVSYVSGAVSGAFNGLIGVVSRVSSTVSNLITKLASIVVPKALMGKSPSPFERSLAGINAELSRTNALARAFNIMAPDLAAGGEGGRVRGRGAGTYIENVDINMRDTNLTPETIKWAVNRLAYD